MTIHFHSIPATFRPIRRNGTTSFKFWAQANMPDAELVFEETSDGGLIHYSPAQLIERWGNPGTTFGFVRNPYSRLVSGFHWLGQQAERRLKQRRYTKDGTYPFPLEMDVKIANYYSKGFDWWIKHEISVCDHELNPYGTMALFENPRQTQLFCWDYTLPDLVIKLEELDHRFNEVQDILKCDAPMFLMNVSRHDDYRSYFTTETQAMAAKWLEEDLDTFKYTF